MFDMGFAELLIISIVALLVIGPERLPAVAKKAGYYIARVQRFVSNVRTDVEREFRTDELQKMLSQQQTELQSLKEIVKDTVTETQKDIDLDSIEKSIGPSDVSSKNISPPNDSVDTGPVTKKQETESP